MKEPRDILFARHQAAVPQLDAIRLEALLELNNKETKERIQPVFFVAWLLGCSNKLWQELVWPCRQIWTGLAAVWVLLFLFNLSQRDGSQTVIAKSSPPTTMMMTLRDQQKLLNELFADRSLPMDSEPPRIFSPKPRTETMKLLAA